MENQPVGQDVFLTNDKWVLQGGKLDPVDMAVMKEASPDGKPVLMSLKQLLEQMQKEEPGKFQQFKEDLYKQLKVTVGTREVPIEEMVHLSLEADNRRKEWIKGFDLFMPDEVARRIRKLRVEDRYSWRSIARMAHGTAIWCAWQPSSNQLAGMALCEVAAKRLGEDWEKDPWN